MQWNDILQFIRISTCNSKKLFSEHVRFPLSHVCTVHNVRNSTQHFKCNVIPDTHASTHVHTHTHTTRKQFLKVFHISYFPCKNKNATFQTKCHHPPEKLHFQSYLISYFHNTVCHKRHTILEYHLQSTSHAIYHYINTVRRKRSPRK